MAEDVARQIEIGQGDGEQQRCNYRTRVYAGESLKTRKQRFDLFAGLVQLPQGKVPSAEDTPFAKETAPPQDR